MAEVATFDAGGDLRAEKAPAVFDPSTMERARPARGRGARPKDQGIFGEPDAKPDATTASAGGSRGGDAALPPGAEVDWAGAVVRPTGRRHHVDVAIKESLGPGLTPQVEEEKKPTRKHFERDLRFASVDQTAAGAPLASAAYQLGPGGEHSAKEWVSTSAAPFDEDRESVVPGGKQKGGGRRSAPVPGLPPSDDHLAKMERARLAAGEGGVAALAGMPALSTRRGSDGGSLTSSRVGPAHRSGLHTGYSDPSTLGPGGDTPGARFVGGVARGRGGNSMLSNIGAKIASRVEFTPDIDPEVALRSRKAAEGSAQAPSRGVSGYTGYKPANPGVRSRDAGVVMEEGLRSQYAVLSNYSSTMPGHTGYKPMDPKHMK